MRRGVFAILFPLILPVFVNAQDEGTVVKRERIQLSKSIFVGGGASVVGASNFADYSTGKNFEAGYMSRLNRIVSIGGSFTFLRFNYSPSLYSQSRTPGTVLTANNQNAVNFFYGLDASSKEVGALLDLKGGNLGLINLAFSLKVNFVPVKDNSVISIYAFAKPFITDVRRSSLSADETTYTRNVANNWVVDKVVPQSYPANSQVTGGIFLGPGIEFFPAKKMSFFIQAGYGYTFPIEVVSTRSYSKDISSLSNPSFPFKKSGFTSVNFAGGLSFNLN